jgi:Cu/Ag efflux pump CusA
VVPTFVSTLCICIVWLPLFQLSGVSGYLFLPLAEAIIFAMIASFILSRTLVPTMAAFLLRAQVAAQRRANRPKAFRPVPGGVRAAIRSVSRRYRDLLAKAVARRGRFILAFLGGDARLGNLLVPWLGQDFFPGSSPARSTCISVRRSACASRRPARSRRWWMRRSRFVAGPRHQRHRQLRPAGERLQPGLQRER